MKSHTLMQTIARANRIHEGKNNGLIVDYIETYKRLLEALAIYALGVDKSEEGGEGGGELPVKPLEELIEDLREAIELTVIFLKDEVDFEMNDIIDVEGLQRLAAIQNGVNAVNTNDQTRNKFGVLAREVFKKYKALMPDELINEIRPQRDAINAIYGVIEGVIEDADISAVMHSVHQVVDRAIEMKNIALDPVVGYGEKVDLSGLDFELIEKEFLKTEHKNTMVQDLKSTVEKKLNQMLDQNPLRVDFYEKYQEIIKDYNEGNEKGAVERVFQKLRKLAEDLTEEEARAKSEGMSENQLTLFDILRQGKKLSQKEKDKVKEIAIGLLEELEKDKLNVDHWMEKTQTSAAVKKTINDYLFNELPYPTYQEIDIDEKAFVLFEHFKSNYAVAS